MKEYIQMFSRTFDFKGKSSLREYWMAWLVSFIVSSLLFVFALPFIKNLTLFNIIYDCVSSLYSIIVFLPTLSLTIRRLHDIKKSGWWVLISLVPLVGQIILIINLAKPSSFKAELINKDYQQNTKTVEQLQKEVNEQDSDIYNSSENLTADINSQSQQNNLITEEIEKKNKFKEQQIMKLLELKDSGAITEEEYNNLLDKVLKS